MPNKHDNGFFLYMWNWCFVTKLKIEPTPENSSLSPTFWLDPKSSQKDQDCEFDSLWRSYSEWIFLTSSKGFSSDFVTRCLAHELAAMFSIRVWQCSLKNVEFYVGQDSISNFFEVNTTFIFKIYSPRMKGCNANPHDEVASKFLAVWAEVRERVSEILARRKMRVVISFKR